MRRVFRNIYSKEAQTRRKEACEGMCVCVCVCVCVCAHGDYVCFLSCAHTGVLYQYCLQTRTNLGITNAEVRLSLSLPRTCCYV
jgi:hypothetical protein